ncbi:MAG: GNAT family N-acetyltransferase [Lachnospiraceae bacterium]|nr:GNAT family N-acetyltransferase [Lachnospiraceae bacterium]
MNIVWKFITHKDIRGELIQIATIKDQHWIHGISSQIKWIEENIDDQDIHLMGINNDSKEIIAYMALMNVIVEINTFSFSLLGLSNVCVDNRFAGKGLGSQLVNQANKYIVENQKNGILLCKDSLLSFYDKNGWSLLKYKEAYIMDDLYDKNVMLFNVPLIPNNCCIKISKNF